MCENEDVIGTMFYIMEMLEGRFFENPSFPDVSEHDRTEMWKEAVRTLGKLHRVRPKDVGLEKFGKPSGFYNRQIKTFSQLAESQASAKDADSGEPVGQLPHFDEFIKFFSEEKYQPTDRGVLYHGDYKIDNLVYHKTEPRVIGILDWEMSEPCPDSVIITNAANIHFLGTVGHPLADLCNLIQPWTISNTTPSWPRIHGDEAFLDPSDPKSKASKFPGLPTGEQVVKWYTETAGFDIPEEELTWAASFALFRDAIIFQGIAARYATRQATSDSAQKYGAERTPFAEMAWKTVEDAKAKQGTQSKL